jgi:hypothetical protein
MTETTGQRIHDLFPDVKLLQTYSMSELDILRSKYDSNFVWVKIGSKGIEPKEGQRYPPCLRPVG